MELRAANIERPAPRKRKRDKYVSLWLTEAEREALRRNAEHCGMSVAELLRAALRAGLLGPYKTLASD